MTGCDHKCGYYWLGKKAVIKKVMKSSKVRVLLHEFGDVLPILAHVLNNLRTLVIKYVYGSKKLGYAETQTTQWGKMKKKSTQRLMPNEDILNHICLGGNCLAHCQKNLHPSSLSNGKC